MYLNLSGGDLKQWSVVLHLIANIATEDHKLKKPRRTQMQLRDLIDRCRVAHQRLLSTVYNQMRDELERVAQGK